MVSGVEETRGRCVAVKQAASERRFSVSWRAGPATQASLTVSSGTSNLEGVRVQGFMGVHVQGVAAWLDAA